MNDLSAHLRVVTRNAIYFFVGCLLLWAIVPNIRPYVAGLMLGALVSLFNTHLLALKIQQISQRVLELEGKRVGTGFLSRVSMVLIAVLISAKLSHFSLVFTLIGLFLVQLATLLMGILKAFKK